MSVPLGGDIFNNPPIPSEFTGLGITPGILVTCHAVTNGPDRNIYWVYDDIRSSDTAIQTPVHRGVCFETRDSIATSQARALLTDTCSTCNRTLAQHMTVTQATTAFTCHAAAFPTTHVRVITPLPLGVASTTCTASILGITAPISAVGVGAGSIASRVITANTPSIQAGREDYKLLISMASNRDKWSSTKSIAHEFISKLETALRQSPISAVHWIYFLPLMVSEHDRNMQEWIEANITSPNLSWNAAKNIFISHYERADWMDSLRVKYQECVQGTNELVQKYTDRFSALMRHLSIGDADVLNIVHYMKGLRSVIYSRLIEHRSDMRNLPLAGSVAAAPNPSWDFVSFDYVSSKASSFENELAAAVRDQARVKHTPAAAAHDNTTRTTHGQQHKRKAFAGPKRGSTSPRKRVHVRSGVHCKWHPDSQSHSTKDCRNPGTTVSRSGSGSSSVSSHAGARKTEDLSQVQCYGCNKMGHYKPDCPNKDQWTKTTNTNTTNTKTTTNKQGYKGKQPKARAASVAFDSSASQQE